MRCLPDPNVSDAGRDGSIPGGMREHGLLLDPEVIAGGVESLRLNLVPLLAGHFRKLTWAVPAHVVSAFAREVRQAPNIRVVPIAWPVSDLRKWAGAIERRIGTPSPHKIWNWLLDEHEPDFVLSTCVFNQPPLECSIPVFGVVCDVNPVLPATTIRNIASWLKAGATLLAISEFTKSELIRLTPGYKDQIYTLPLAANAGVRRPFQRSGGRFRFLCPAAAAGHKNHLLIFQAALDLANRGFDFEIVLTGPCTDRFWSDRIFTDPKTDSARTFFKSNAAILSKHIVAKGNLPRTELEELYESSSAVLLASSYEGFGLPLAEGLGFGLPILCSNLPAYREQLSLYQSEDRARLFEKDNCGALTQAMISALTSPMARLEPGPANDRMKRWTWPDCARRCASIIQENILIRA